MVMIFLMDNVVNNDTIPPMQLKEVVDKQYQNVSDVNKP
jgi:hypothetical protein